jgi:hypothetical protein
VSEISERCGGGDAGRPLVAGTLRGYRTWRGVTRWTQVPEGALPLTAVTQRGIVWSPMLTAQCSPLKLRRPPEGSPEDAPDHPAPSPGCTCGIYAWYEPEDAGILNARVFGAIQASGVVLMGERGFRAERARVVAVVTRNRRLCAACEAAGIAVYRNRRSLLRDYPPEDLRSLLGDRTAVGEEAHRDAAVPTTSVDHRMLFYAVCGRALTIALAALLLPGVIAAALIVAVEVLLIIMLATRLP